MLSLSGHALSLVNFGDILDRPNSPCYAMLTAELGTSTMSDHLPRYFAKAGHVDANPNKMKKNGAGKGGW